MITGTSLHRVFIRTLLFIFLIIASTCALFAAPDSPARGSTVARGGYVTPPLSPVVPCSHTRSCVHYNAAKEQVNSVGGIYVALLQNAGILSVDNGTSINNLVTRIGELTNGTATPIENELIIAHVLLIALCKREHIIDPAHTEPFTQMAYDMLKDVMIMRGLASDSSAP